MSQKRPDIQGLRCICILMVLLYHYYPRIFPQGRLGVDMFFVISGFLIALMLSKRKDGVTAYFVQFYWRRVKRILPLCYLVFLFSYITMYLLQMETFISINKHFGLRALLFLANVKISNEDQYETQLMDAKILLTHYWSLSTEIQFYLLAPVIVLCVLRYSPKTVTFSFCFLAAISLLHYVTTNETISFNSPLARLWQFMAGFTAYHNQLEFHPSKEYTRRLRTDLIISYFSIFAVCSLLFIPSPTFFLDTLFRIIVTLSTMWILTSVGENPKFLEHPLSVYMGDISFALYLVHWPILCFVKAYSIDVPCVRTLEIPLAFALSIGLAVFLHETFEKRYPQWGTVCNIIVIITLIVGCSILVFGNFEKTKKAPLETDDFFEKAIELNLKLNVKFQDYHQNSKYAKPFKLKGFEKIDKQQDKRLTLMTGGTGNLTILIIGNSYARNHGDLIYEGLKSLHNKIYTYRTSQCETLVASQEWDKKFGCVRKAMKNSELLELLKPDLLFIVERGISIKHKLSSETILEDKYMKEIIKNLDTFQKFTKRIFILGAIPPLALPLPVHKAIEILKKKQRLRDAPSLVVNDNLYQRIRHSKIPEVCRKCIVYEWEHVFYNTTGHFVYFTPETDLLLFDSYLHLGGDGKKKMVPFYANLGKEMEWMKKKGTLLL